MRPLVFIITLFLPPPQENAYVTITKYCWGLFIGKFSRFKPYYNTKNCQITIYINCRQTGTKTEKLLLLLQLLLVAVARPPLAWPPFCPV